MTSSDAIPLQSHPGAEPSVDDICPRASNLEALARTTQVQTLRTQVERTSVLELVGYLGDPHPIVRWEAGHALAQIADRLQQRSRLSRSRDSARQRTITFAEALELMGQQLAAEDPVRRAAAADSLGHWRHERAARLLLEAMNDPQPMVRASAATSLGRIAHRSALSPLVDRLSDPSMWVRRAAAEALGALRDSQAVPELRRVALHDRELAATAAIAALGHLPGQRSRRTLISCLSLDDVALQWYAVRSLGQVGGIGAIPALRRYLERQDMVFGRSLGDLAAEAIVKIERRETGWWNRLRKMVLLSYSGIIHLVQTQTQKRRGHTQSALQDEAMDADDIEKN